MTESEATTHLDLRGLKCPLPALRTRKALRTLPAGHLLTVTCTDPMAVIDIPNLVREEGDELVCQERTTAILSFTIRKATLGRPLVEKPDRPPH